MSSVAGAVSSVNVVAADLLNALCKMKRASQDRESQTLADSDAAALLDVLAEPIVPLVLLQQLTVYVKLLHEEHTSLAAAEQQQQQQPPAVLGQSSSSQQEPMRRQPSKQRFRADLLDIPPFHLDLLQRPDLASKAYWDEATTHVWPGGQEKWLLYCQRARQMVYCA
jgi:hypothetical protein